LVVFGAIFFFLIYTFSTYHRINEDKWLMTFIILPQFSICQAMVGVFLVLVTVNLVEYAITSCVLVFCVFFTMGFWSLYAQPALGSSRDINHHYVSVYFTSAWVSCLVFFSVCYPMSLLALGLSVGLTIPVFAFLFFELSKLRQKKQDASLMNLCRNLLLYRSKGSKINTEEGMIMKSARSFTMLSLMPEYSDELCNKVAANCIPLYKDFLLSTNDEDEETTAKILDILTRGLSNLSSGSQDNRRALIKCGICPWLF